MFNHAIKTLFANPIAGAVFLFANGLLLYFGDRQVIGPCICLKELTWREALVVGAAQCLALLPGISRSGAAVIGGLRVGLSEPDAAHFSFLLATPAILGAGILEIPKLTRLEPDVIDPLQAMVGGILAGFVAYVSIMILMAWFRGHAVQALRPFAVYCVIFSLFSLGIFLIF
jgi:undecaprenyl-diphosphatase